MLLRGAISSPRPTSAARPRYDFSQEAIEKSLERSLKRLRRDRADLFLAHEPNRLDLTPEVEARFQKLVDQDLVGAFGAGVDVREDQWAPFGSVWQSGWPGDCITEYSNNVMHVYHGVMRYAKQDRYGRTEQPVAELLRSAREASPHSVLLVSASTPKRLRQLVEAANELT